jgi:hypothetical protein
MLGATTNEADWMEPRYRCRAIVRHDKPGTRDWGDNPEATKLLLHMTARVAVRAAREGLW